MHLRAHLRFHFREQLKIHKHVKKKMHFTHQLMINLTVQSRRAVEGAVDSAPKDSLRDLNKEAQKCACKVPL